MVSGCERGPRAQDQGVGMWLGIWVRRRGLVCIYAWGNSEWCQVLFGKDSAHSGLIPTHRFNGRLLDRFIVWLIWLLPGGGFLGAVRIPEMWIYSICISICLYWTPSAARLFTKNSMYHFIMATDSVWRSSSALNYFVIFITTWLTNHCCTFRALKECTGPPIIINMFTWNVFFLRGAVWRLWSVYGGRQALQYLYYIYFSHLKISISVQVSPIFRPVAIRMPCLTLQQGTWSCNLCSLHIHTQLYHTAGCALGQGSLVIGWLSSPLEPHTEWSLY